MLGSRLVERTAGFSTDYGYDTRLTGFDLAAEVPPARLAEACAVIEAACRPLAPAKLMQELTAVRLAVVSNLRGNDLKGWMMVVSEDVAEFPAAVVIGACRRWRRREKFLPSCAELVEECHQLNKRRRAIRRLFEGKAGGQVVSLKPSYR